MKKKKVSVKPSNAAYLEFTKEISSVLEEARHQAVKTVSTFLTVAYWEIGRKIVEFEQGGEHKAIYGEELIDSLSRDLTAKFGRGFGRTNLFQMRAFYLAYPEIVQTPSGQSNKLPKASSTKNKRTKERLSISDHLSRLAEFFPLSWSHYVRLLSVKYPETRKFYETEAIQGGWSVRQLDRQISTLFYERTALSKNKVAMLNRGRKAKPEDIVTVEEEIKDPMVLEFLGLKDEYSESQLEEALIQHLEHFLLELGNNFAFIGRQKRIRIGDTWYRMDLLFYHRRLRCLVVIDLKVGKFTPSDIGQMNLYLNYVSEHLKLPEENPPVGLILCSEQNKAVAHYALGNLANKVIAAEYQITLPNTKQLKEEIEKTRKCLQNLPTQGLLENKITPKAPETKKKRKKGTIVK
jgi:predicted nuclease of restriction endonuclease-like (RecB) superfamily